MEQAVYDSVDILATFLHEGIGEMKEYGTNIDGENRKDGTEVEMTDFSNIEFTIQWMTESKTHT